MQFQRKPWWCGPAAIHNALELLGRQVPQATIANLAGTTSEGTDSDAMLSALGQLSVDAYLVDYSNVGTAIDWIHGRLLVGPAILCVQNWGHWVTAIGRTNGKYLLFDPANYDYNHSRGGVLVLSGRQLVRKWRAGRRMAAGAPPFHAIALS